MRQTVALKRLSVAVIAALLAAMAATVVLSGETKPATAAVPGVNVPAGYDSEVFFDGDPLAIPMELLFDSSGNLLVTDWGPGSEGGKLVSINPDRSANVLASGTPLVDTDGMAFGTGNSWGNSLYVSDHNASGDLGQIFKFESASLSPFTTPGTPWGSIDPKGLAFGPGGAFGTDLYVADCDRGQTCASGTTGGAIYRVDPSGNKTLVHLGDPLVAPHGLRFGPGGGFGNDLYVADLGDWYSGTGYIWRIDASGQPTLFAGGPGSAMVDPAGLTFAPGGVFGSDLYVLDRGAGTVSKVAASGNIVPFATGLDNHPAAGVGGGGIAFGPNGKDLYVVSGSSIIRIFPTDTTKPAITLNSPTDGATYTQGQNVTANYSCSDDISSGSDLSCNGAVPNGSTIDTSSAGTKTFSATATDKAGNIETKTVSYNVVSPCTIGEIGPPVNDVSSAGDPGMSAYKFGSRGVIPAKFRAACNGDPIDTQAEAEAHPMKLKLTKLGATPDQDAVVENTVTGSANSGDLFRFDDVADHYIYNIGVKNLASGTYKLTISEVNGGATHDEWFSVK
jgi:hypothetical protein